MKLGAWLTNEGVTRDAFASRIGVNAASVSRYINGDRVPRRPIMFRIRKETRGEVTANDFLETTEAAANEVPAGAVAAGDPPPPTDQPKRTSKSAIAA